MIPRGTTFEFDYPYGVDSWKKTEAKNILLLYLWAVRVETGYVCHLQAHVSCQWTNRWKNKQAKDVRKTFFVIQLTISKTFIFLVRFPIVRPVKVDLRMVWFLTQKTTEVIHLQTEVTELNGSALIWSSWRCLWHRLNSDSGASSTSLNSLNL